MNLLETFGPVWDAAGARGFAGEGYWHHKLIPGLSFKGSTFVAKTMTTYPNAGHMPLTADYTPQSLFPKCIVLYPRLNAALNAVGLSGPGVEAFLGTGRWQEIQEPFFISFMPILGPDDMLVNWEVYDFVRRIEATKFKTSRLGIQISVMCPNVGADMNAVVQKALMLLDAFRRLGYTLIVKITILIEPAAAAVIAKHPACDGLCVSNAVPFGTVLPQEWWDMYFPNGSPLAERGLPPGGLSGAPIFPFVVEWLKRFRALDPHTHVNVGGGIMRPDNVDEVRAAGASSIFIGTVAMLRPWRVQKIIKRAHSLFIH